jgi:DNA processing protein
MPHTEHMTARNPGGRYRPPTDIAVVARDQAFWPPLTDAALGRAPDRLYAAGNIALLRAPTRVSIVGARDASDDGCRRAARLARLLAGAGIVVVSGLAKGIDRAAHQATIDAGGFTIAVIGLPLDKCYPPDHARLQEEIYTGHLLVSQFPSGARTHPSFFPARNRTMAMLSHASVIVEAGDTSGSLSQAAETQRLGRPLFIMRNVVENPSLTWPASFLRHGAIVLDDVQQVLDLGGHAG